MNFSDKVKKQKAKEREIFRLSCETIESTALGVDDKDRKVVLEKHTDQLSNAIDRVTDFYGMNRIDVPKEAVHDDGMLDTVLGRSGLTRRKVSLSKKWWIRGEGPLVAYDTNDDIICLIPLKFSTPK